MERLQRERRKKTPAPDKTHTTQIEITQEKQEKNLEEATFEGVFK